MSGFSDAQVEAAARALCELENAPNCVPADYYGEAIAALTAAHVPELLAVVESARRLRNVQAACREAWQRWSDEHNGDYAMAYANVMVATEDAEADLAAALANLPSEEETK